MTRIFRDAANLRVSVAKARGGYVTEAGLSVRTGNFLGRIPPQILTKTFKD